MKSLTDWWTDAGAPPDASLAALQRNIARPAPKAASSPNQAKQTQPTVPTPKRLRIDPATEAQRLAGGANTIEALKTACNEFEGCDLRRSARKLVFCDGNPNAEVMIIGEAPGSDEDKAGKPFVGRSGQLLDKMFAAISLTRSENLYITNTVFWHPPGNRDPSPQETAVCAPFLHRQIQLIQPKVIVAVGKFAAHSLLKTNEGPMKLRGRRMRYEQEGLASAITCIPILHPAYLLRRPADKALAWKDLQLIQNVMAEPDG